MANYKTSWVQRLIEGVWQKTFAFAHAKTVYTDYANKKTLADKLSEIDTEIGNKANKTEIPTELPANGGNSATVNGHTVKSDVPENAKFTDTIYDDTEVKEEIASINSNLTSEISRAKETEETLKSRIDTITSLPEGSTTGDAELQDIRVKADGTTATSAGNAVREQVSELKGDLGELKDGRYNIFDKNDVVPGYISNSNGSVSSNENYVTTSRIQVKANEPIVISPRIRKFLAFDSSRQPITNSYTDEVSEPFVFTPTVDGSVRITFYKSDIDIAMVQNGEIPSDVYVPQNHTLLSNDVVLNKSQIDVIDKKIDKKIDENNSTNILYGKKWVACGDSFTHGDFSNSLTNDYIFTDGKYKGKYKVYPYFIGNRNNMDIINEAVNGSSMTYVGGSRHEFSTENGRYTQIPSDADYITLYFGINDDNAHATLGTIDDTENTTFYGAWNIVMEHIITNHPLAKIGIIITNGSAIEYVNAEIAIAEKFGIPYLNMATGVQVPTMHRTNKNLPSSIATVRHNTFCVNPANNGHPNEKAHEYESTFIENWLRSL